MIHKILLAYDGSASSMAALEFALDLARRYGARLDVLGVVRPPEFGDDVETEAWVERSQQQLRNIMQPVKARAAREGVPYEVEIAVGHPAEQIVRYAEGHDIDHIVVGHRGHTLFDRWLIGSVARQVIAYANCAVTVVRPAGKSAKAD
jgi:nucleotide-binding universal stress UspA family protein